MLRKILKVLLVLAAAGFIAIQFIRPTFTNPPVVESETLAATTVVPPEVEQILTRSCNDCHSNQTFYPWYAHVTPFNWFLADHIEEGRRQLNFNRWNTYTREQKIHRLDELCEVVEEGSMPLPSYLWIHYDAKLTKSESELLCSWSRAEAANLETRR